MKISHQKVAKGKDVEWYKVSLTTESDEEKTFLDIVKKEGALSFEEVQRWNKLVEEISQVIDSELILDGASRVNDNNELIVSMGLKNPPPAVAVKKAFTPQKQHHKPNQYQKNKRPPFKRNNNNSNNNNNNNNNRRRG